MSQQGKAFVPDVLVVTRGTSVHFPNRDSVRHHVYSFSPIKKFELKLYTGTPANPVVFDKSGVAVLGCNIHDHMVGWVLVLDTPYFGTSAAPGVVRLDNSLVSCRRSTRCVGAAKKPMRQLGARILAKPPT